MNAAWYSGITVLPSTRSFAAPDTFIATSHMPLPAPKIARNEKIG